MPSSTSLRKRSDLRKYQVWLAEKIVEDPALLCAVDMGLGKTAAALTAARQLLDEFVVLKVLVVAPLRVAKDTWPDEIAAWEHTRVLSYTVIRAEDEDEDIAGAADAAYEDYRALAMPPRQAEKHRREARAEAKEAKLRRLASEPTEIHIINREKIPWLWKFWGDRWPYDLVIWDESSRLKAGRMRVYRPKVTDGTKKKRPPAPLSEFGSIASARKHFERVVELTGTPAPNGLEDLWGQIYLLDLGKRLGTSRTAFLNRWFRSDYMGWNWEPFDHSQKEILARIEDVMVGLRAEDYLELPPVIPNDRKVRLPDKIMAEYRRFERTLVSEVYDVEAVNSGVLTNKLLQFANGSLYRNLEGKKQREVVEVHDLKLDELERIVEESAGQPLLVAYSFKFDLDRIKKKYPKAVIFDKAPNAVKDWNAGRIGMLLAHPASIGHGLNMQFGGHILVWYGLTWSLELYQQFNKRLPRPGQPWPHVIQHHIVAEGTADEDVLAAMGTKDATQSAVTGAVRKRLLNLL